MPEQNVNNCIRRLFEDVWNRGQTELIKEICSSNFICNFGTEASAKQRPIKAGHRPVVGGIPGHSARNHGHRGSKRQDSNPLARPWHSSRLVHGHSCNG